ncbi:MAG: siroheme synthase CysG [Pseudomonadota bacterium]
MDYLPVCLKLRTERVLLVGGGAVGTRKARLLLKAGASMTLVAPEITADMERLLSEHDATWQQREYDEHDLEGHALVIAATPDSAINRHIHDGARARGMNVNVVDTPELCTFIFPSIVDRNPLLIAISSSGQSPVLARKLRRRFEAMLPGAYGRLAEFAGRLREPVKAALPSDTPRRLFWEAAIDGAVGEMVLAGQEEEAERLLRENLTRTEALHRGEVYLVGAGPGDPDLMTFKAMRLLQSADVVLYDRLVAPAIVEMARRDAELIYVGKRRADHAVPQTDINELLVQLAEEGKRVIRLKGGDPFIFGRGGEEIELLAQRQIPFQVVPGITAASGAACYAGIPLTHRDHAQSVRFVTGHLKNGKLEHDWSQFQSTNETVVFYMGLVGLTEICEQLRKAGRADNTPVALIEKATTSQQKVLISNLVSLPEIVSKEKVRAPTLIIVGKVVGLSSQLGWFQ